MRPDLDAIRARCKALDLAWWNAPEAASAKRILDDDVPVLLDYIRELETVLDEIEAAYPEDVFIPPPWDGEPTRDAVAAESARHTIRLIREAVGVLSLPPQKETAP